MSTESRNSRARKAAVVVEIGRDWLKIAETGCTGRNVTFSRLHIERIGEDDASLPDCVKTACRELKLVGKRTLLALPRHMVNVRILKLPSTDPDEVAGMVELQMARQTPYSKNEILTDYRVLGVESEGYTRVLLAIAQHGAVRNHVSVLEEAGLDVEQVCLSSEGVHAWVAEEHLDPADGRGVAIVDMDAAFTDMLVSLHGGIVFSRSIRVGAQQFQDEASGPVEELATEIKRGLDACRTDCPGVTLDRVIVSGAGAALAGLCRELQSRLALPVEPADALQRVRRTSGAPGVRDPAFKSVSLTALVGIALAPRRIELDLMPETVQLRKRMVARSRSFSAMICLLMTCTVGLSLVATLSLFFRHGELRRRELEKQRTDAGVQLVQRQVAVLKMIRDRRNLAGSAQNLLAEIQKARVNGLYIVQLDIDRERGKVSIAGSGAAMADVRAFVNNLQRCPLFRDVKPGSTTLDPEGRYSFQVTSGLGGVL